MDKFENESVSNEEKLAEVVTQGAVTEIKNLTKPLFDMLGGVVKGLENSFKTQELSYEAAVKFLFDHKHDSPNIKKAVLCKEKTENGYVVAAAFMDKDDQVVCDKMTRPIGGAWEVERLDDELLKTFKDKNTIVFQ
ncbi:MAG: hypothetical protein LBB48_02725 [Treponema sp.]|jgi:hypothetical protein|nr:hypothetical protein [Treponema sp.]